MLHLHLKTLARVPVCKYILCRLTGTDGEDGYDNNIRSDHEVEDYSNLDLDEILDDIDDEGVNDDKKVSESSVRNLSRGIIIPNDSRAHMSNVNPNVMHASEFPEYLKILHVYLLS